MQTYRYLCAVAVAASAGAAVAGPYSDLGIFVYGDYYSTSEVEGRAIIGGNLNGPSSNYGIKLNPAAYNGVTTLTVGGNMNANSIQLQAGNARIGGALNGVINYNGGGSLVNSAGVMNEIAQMRSIFAGASASYAAMGATGSVSLPGSQPSSVNFTATPGGGGVSVINIDGADLFSNNNVQTIGIDMAGSDYVVINVAGAAIDFTTGGNFAGAFATDAVRSRVLWNFFEAESIDLRGKAFEGSILATDAFLTHNGVISGSVFVDSLNSESEVHLPGFDFNIPAPGRVAALATVGLVASRRRRNA